MKRWKIAFIDAFYIIAVSCTFGFFATMAAVFALKVTGFEGLNQTNIVVTDEQVKKITSKNKEFGSEE